MELNDLKPVSQFIGGMSRRRTLLRVATSLFARPLLGAVIFDAYSQPHRVRKYLPIEADFPETYAWHIEEGILSDEFIVTQNNDVFIDTSIHSAATSGKDYGSIFGRFKERLSLCEAEIDRRYDQVSAMVFHNEGGSTWGHFLVQNLPKALLYLEKFPDGKLIVPAAHAIHRASNFNRAFELLGIGQDRILAVERFKSYLFKELIIVDFMYEFEKQIAHPYALDLLERATIDLSDVRNSRRRRRIYIDRSASVGRNIANSPRTLELVRRYGLEIQDFGSLTLDEQILAWSHADLVVSVLGSDLANIVFGKRGTRVLSLSPDWFGDTFFYHLAIMKGMPWFELRCGQLVQPASVPHKSSFNVDLNHLEIMMDSL